MQKCTFCGAELPENARFCGKCGNVQDASATDVATTRSSNTPPPPPPLAPPAGSQSGTQQASWSSPPNTYPTPAYPAPTQASSGYPASAYPAWGTPQPLAPIQGNQDERRGIPPYVPLYGADILIGGGQPYAPGVPVVQGTPQIGSVPNVAGTPTSYGDLAGHIGQAPSQAPGVQGSSTYYPQQAGQQAPQHYMPGQPALHAHHAAAGATKVASGSALKTIIIVVTTIVVIGAGGIAAAAYFLSRPQPLISVTSSFKFGNALAGASGTVLHISGQKFSDNSAITFLLDGNPAPGNSGAHSDSHGNFRTNVKITDGWSVGTHTLTARDAGNHDTKNSVSVTIVQPGTANTPGPNGAPPDDATFTTSAALNGHFTSITRSFSTTEDLATTGHPDPTGGTVCAERDDGKVHFYDYSTIDTDTPYNEHVAYSCKGTYKSGKITYTETLLSDVITYTNTATPVSCTLNGPQTYQNLTGTYSSDGTFTGTFTYGGIPQSDFPCTGASGADFFYYGIAGTWTGTISGLKS